MTYRDLPRDWATRALTDPRLLNNVLDLIVDEGSRLCGGVFVLLCDERGRLLQPVAIDGVPADITAGQARQSLRNLLRAAEAAVDFESFLVAVARRSGLSVRPGDLSWAKAAEEFRGRHRLLGVHVVTLDGSRPVFKPLPAA